MAVETHTIRCYKNTGFTPVNVPDGASLLSQFEYDEYTNVDVVQSLHLPVIRIPCNWRVASQYDYVYVSQNWRSTDTNSFMFSGYYSCVANMVSADVAELTLTPDWWMTCGGVTKLMNTSSIYTITGGVTERITPPDDTLGKYTESDPLLMPSMPLVLKMAWKSPDRNSSGTIDLYSLVDSTINLVKTASMSRGRTYTDTDGNSVTVPMAAYIGEKTNTLSEYLGGTDYSMKTGMYSTTVNPGTQVYNLDDTTKGSNSTQTSGNSARLGMTVCRTLGIEQGILNQVLIPKVFVDLDYWTTTMEGYGGEILTNHPVSMITGKNGSLSSGLGWEPYEYSESGYGIDSVKQESNLVWSRLIMSDYCPWGLVTAAGDSCEYMGYDIYDKQYSTPQIVWLSDPRLDGKPYYRFGSVNGLKYQQSDMGWSDPGFFRSAVAGMVWKQVPLVWTGTSGSALNTLNYQNSRKVADTAYQQAREPLVEELKQFNQGINGAAGGSIIQSLRSGLKDFFAGFGDASAAGRSVNNINRLFGDNSGMTSGEWELYQKSQPIYALRANYQAAKQAELSALAVTNSVSIPTVSIPYSSDAMRDFWGNGVLVYHHTYQTPDLHRINKLLTMYGYKITKAVEKSDFTNRKYFNYIECRGLTFSGIPRYMSEGLSAQLNNGVRIWHVKPSPNYYTNKSSNPLN